MILEFNGTAFPTVRYFQGAGTDQVLAQESAGTVSWMLTDHLGSVRDLVNTSGAVMNHFTYDSFGNLLSSIPGATADTRYKFTGRELDSETGMYYYRARYYDAGIGRFIGQDPIGFEAGDNNLYRYVGNSSLQNTDPSGLASQELAQLLSIAKPRGGSLKDDTIFIYPTSPNYSIALSVATSWFYVISKRETRFGGETKQKAWLLGGSLKGDRGKAVLRPFGTKSDAPDPTVELQAEPKGVYHATPVNGITTKASEVKFPFKQGDPQTLSCPLPQPSVEPVLGKNGYPTYPITGSGKGSTQPWYIKILEEFMKNIRKVPPLLS